MKTAITGKGRKVLMWQGNRERMEKMWFKIEF
jgi:hypothetical protein